MNDISAAAVSALIGKLWSRNFRSDLGAAADMLDALRAALDEAEAEIERQQETADEAKRLWAKTEAERDAANALNERLAERLWFYSPAGYREIFGADAAHLGAKP